MFSVMPISNDDIMIFGDGEIKTAEWWELLGNPNVKNRGTGWNNSEPGVASGCLSVRINGLWSASSENGDMGGIYKASGGRVQSDAYNWTTDWKITPNDDSLITGLTPLVGGRTTAPPIYNLSGIRVSKPEKGSIYIHDGCKMVAK